MAVDMLEHFTVRCGSLERTRDFYFEIIGLRVGPRPDFDSRAIGFIGAISLSRISFAKASTRTAAWFNAARTDRKRPARVRSYRLPRPGFGRHALLRL